MTTDFFDYRLPTTDYRVQDLDQLPAQPGGLLLLHPMAGAVHQVRTLVLGRDRFFESLQRPGVLIHAPVALPADERGRHVDRASREDLKVRVARTAAIAVDPALKSGAAEFPAVHVQLRFRQPALSRT